MYKINVVLIGLVAFIAGPASADYSAGTAGQNHSGNQFRSAACEDGYAVIGLTVKGGTYVDTIQVICGKILSGNRIGTIKGGSSIFSSNLAPFVVPGISSRQESRYCPTSYVVAGIKFKAATYVDRVMTLRCQRLGGTNLQYVGVGIGGNGGSETRLYCRTGNIVSKILGFTGSWVDSVTVHCK